MKKFGLFMLALVVALGLLGIGYAKWTDTVVINGTVSSGSVVVGILDVPNPPYSDPPGTVDPRVVPHEPGTVYVWASVFDKDVATTNSINLEPKCLIGQQQYYGKVHEEFINVYPFYAVNQDIWLANCGTVPIKVDSWNIVNIVDPDGVLPCIQWQWTINGQFNFGTLADLVADLDHYQIEPGQTFDIFFAPIFLECTPQGKNCSFDIVVTASQWNEVP